MLWLIFAKNANLIIRWLHVPQLLRRKRGMVALMARGGLRLHDVCRVVGLLDDDCRDSGVGRKEYRPVHKINYFQSLLRLGFLTPGLCEWGCKFVFFFLIHTNLESQIPDLIFILQQIIVFQVPALTKSTNGQKIRQMTRPPPYSEACTEKREFGIRVSNSEALSESFPSATLDVHVSK